MKNWSKHLPDNLNQTNNQKGTMLFGEPFRTVCQITMHHQYTDAVGEKIKKSDVN